jgi:hypothetical protein
MRTVMAAGLIAVCFSSPAPAQKEHGRYDFPLVVDGQSHILTYEGTHDLMGQVDPAVKLVVFVHHGGSQNAVSYFNSMKAALAEAAVDRPELNLAGTTMIIAPAMIGAQHLADRPDRYSRSRYPYWDGGWREGEPSVNTPRVSNFDLLDGMVLHVAERFPGVRAIVHVGHSAGGQLLSRYLLGTPVYDVLRNRGIYVRYVISNPSSLLYFDRQRPDLASGEGFVDYSSRMPVVGGGECREFNQYKYGLDALVPYMTRRPVAEMLAGFRRRDVFLFLGLADTVLAADGLDRDCPAMLQGRFRLERGQRYYDYLGHFFGREIYKQKFIAFAPGVGHSAREMFRSKVGKPLIFINADSAPASLRQEDAGRAPARFSLVMRRSSRAPALERTKAVAGQPRRPTSPAPQRGDSSLAQLKELRGQRARHRA